MDGIAHLGSTIAPHLREWDTTPAFVELAVFGSDEAASIACAINAFCVRNLGAPIARGLFHQSTRTIIQISYHNASRHLMVLIGTFMAALHVGNNSRPINAEQAQ